MNAAAILEWLVADGEVRVPLSRLADHSGAAESAEGLAELIENGMAEAWEDESRAVLTLTDRAASSFGLVMDDDSFRWIDRDSKPRKVRAELKSAGGVDVVLEADMDGGDGHGDLDWIADERAPDPADQAAAIEAAEDAVGEIEMRRREREILDARYGRRHHATGPPVKEAFPMPAVLLCGVLPWPLPGNVRGSQAPPLPLADYVHHTGPCWACKGKELGPAFACLWCDRSGVDHLLPKVTRPRDVPVVQPGRKLSGGTGKRKAVAKEGAA